MSLCFFISFFRNLATRLFWPMSPVFWDLAAVTPYVKNISLIQTDTAICNVNPVPWFNPEALGGRYIPFEISCDQDTVSIEYCVSMF